MHTTDLAALAARTRLDVSTARIARHDLALTDDQIAAAADLGVFADPDVFAWFGMARLVATSFPEALDAAVTGGAPALEALTYARQANPAGAPNFVWNLPLVVA